MKLVEMTWPEVDERLKSDTSIIIPIGSVEQHGPMGLIGTDAMCAEAVAQRAGKLSGHLVGPTLPIGMAQSHLAFPGTISLKPSTLIAVVKDVVASLTGAGFTHILFLNGHGGNIATLSTAFSEINAERSAMESLPPVTVSMRSWFDLPGIRDLLREMYPSGHGSHATPSEIAMTQALFPHAIKSAELEPKVAPDGGFTDAHDFRCRYPDGRKGADSSLANPQDGERLIEAAAKALAEEFSRIKTV
jgi:creatinine amidohydrolase/Fe(II)-dependent formamide hydrolase-like protein